MAKFSLLAFLIFLVSGCGVKGDPIPPERPPTLGRGRPTYRRATEGLKVEKSQKPTKPSDEEESEDEDNER